jgi:hypothetical protein
MTFWCESGSGSRSADPDPDSDPVPTVFVIDLQDKNKRLILKKFFCSFLFEGTFTSFFKDKKSKRSHKTVGPRFFLLFLLDETCGSGGSGSEFGSGTLPLDVSACFLTKNCTI